MDIDVKATLNFVNSACLKPQMIAGPLKMLARIFTFFPVTIEEDTAVHIW